MTRVVLAHALKNAMATIGAGIVLLATWIGFQAYRYQLGEWEVAKLPVLAAAPVCDGARDPMTRECLGKEIDYPAFAQTESHCEGRDAIVSGTLSKIRRDAVYAKGRQHVFFGDPHGRFRLADWQFNPVGNGPVGVQDWGPWRLVGGCVSIYGSWFTTVEHVPWHGLWPLTTTVGPFPLPKANVH